MTREEMDLELGRLVVLKGMPGDSDPYWDALQSIPIDVFVNAVTHALKTRTWWPVPAELRADCDAVKRAQPVAPVYPRVENLAAPRVMEIPNPLDPERPLRVTLTREWKHDCDTCHDTGWATRWCGPGVPGKPWLSAAHCGRKHEANYAGHEFAEPCSCIEWNPTIRRKKDAMLKYSQEPEKVGS